MDTPQKDYVDVTGCDLVVLVKKAYELSRPQGLGFLHAKDGPLSNEEAHACIKDTDRPRGYIVSLDYVHGRAVKFGVLKDGDRLFVSTRWYDHSQDQLRELLKAIGKELPEMAEA